MKREKFKPDLSSLSSTFDAKSQRRVTVDVEAYQNYLDGSGMSDTQKREFLEAVWSIIVNFVELGFGVHPLQETCGQDAEHGLRGGFQDAGMLDSTDHERSIE